MAGKKRATPVTDEDVLTSYRETFSAYKTAAALGIGATTVERVLTKFNEPRPGLQMYRENATKYRGQELAIREAYEAGSTYLELRERFGDVGSRGDYAIKQAIKRAGGVLRENPAPLVKDGELEKIRELNASGFSQVTISLKIGRSQSFVSRLMRKHGIATLYKAGPEHGLWKGGRSIDSNGYVRVWLSPDDPMASMRLSEGTALEHRLVLARKLGRPLLRTETVHHIDGNKTNNDPENLQLRQGKHGKHVVMCCLDCGSRNIGHAEI